MLALVVCNQQVEHEADVVELAPLCLLLVPQVSQLQSDVADLE